MGVRQHHRVDVSGFDPGFGHALLLPAGGGAERLRCAHAGVEQHELVTRVHDRRVLLEHHIVGRQEIVAQHLLHFFLRHADKRAGGIAERQRTVGNHRDLGAAENEPVPIRCLRAKLGRARQGAAAEHGGGSQAGAERKQGPSRNILCHAFFLHCFYESFSLSPDQSVRRLIERASICCARF
jgi:hypothetical protein